MFRRLNNPIPANCNGCKLEFLKYTWNQKFCRPCRLINDRAHKKRFQMINHAIPKMKVCKFCYRVFRITRGDRDYCHIMCSRKANRIIHLTKRIHEISEQIYRIKVDR